MAETSPWTVVVQRSDRYYHLDDTRKFSRKNFVSHRVRQVSCHSQLQANPNRSLQESIYFRTVFGTTSLEFSLFTLTNWCYLCTLKLASRIWWTSYLFGCAVLCSVVASTAIVCLLLGLTFSSLRQVLFPFSERVNFRGALLTTYRFS